MTNRAYTLLYLAAGYILPLLPKYSAIGHYKVLLLMASCIFMLICANPPLKSKEAPTGDSDRGTFALIFFMAYIAILAPLLEWAYFKTDQGWSFWTSVGLLLIVGGLGFRYWSLRVLGRYFTGKVQQVEEHQLITSGPYKYIRHPSYLGAMVAMAGCAILLEAWGGLVVAIASMGIAYFYRIKAEEQLLLGVFGEKYTIYQHNTWRLVPGLF